MRWWSLSAPGIVLDTLNGASVRIAIITANAAVKTKAMVLRSDSRANFGGV